MMNFENDDEHSRVRCAETVVACLSRIVHSAEGNRVCARAMPETASFGPFLQPRYAAIGQADNAETPVDILLP